MSKIRIDQISEFEQSGGDIDYFSALKNDKDTAIIRLMYQHEDEFMANVVHQVEVTNKDGKQIKRYVGCLAPDGQPCPLCNGGYFRQIKLFIHLLHDGKYKIWERGKTMAPKLMGLFPRYGRGESGLWSRQFEVQRNGAKGDPKTTYEFYPLDQDGKSPQDFADIEKVDVDKTLILSWDAETMKRFLSGEDVYNAGTDGESATNPPITPRVNTMSNTNDTELF